VDRVRGPAQGSAPASGERANPKPLGTVDPILTRGPIEI
jgi:hypothetical protein